MIVFLRRKRNTNPQAASNLDSHWKLEYSFDGKKWAPIHYDKVTCGLVGAKNSRKIADKILRFREMMNKILQGKTVAVSAAKQLDSDELRVYRVLEELEASTWGRMEI